MNLIIKSRIGNYSTFLTKRWNLKKSPFWIQDPQDQSLSFPHYPHTGDYSKVIWISSIEKFIGFKCIKTTQGFKVIHLSTEEGIALYSKDGEQFYDLDISQDKIIDILIEDGWVRY